MTWRILQGDCREVLATLPAESVQTCITSPPYWGLRDYGHAGQLGLERTPEEYVARMVEAFREVRRVLRPDGTLWLNLGDSYAAASNRTTGRNDPDFNKRTRMRYGKWSDAHGYAADQPRSVLEVASGLKPKDLIGIPWRVAFALQADGWWLRSDIIWAKPNPMPESVTDRPTKAHEYLFLLAKSERYFYDAEAIRESFAPTTIADARVGTQRVADFGAAAAKYGDETSAARRCARNAVGDPGAGRNRRSVWTISTKPFSGAHFAVMPWDLVEPCVLAGTSERGQCPECGAPWDRVVDVEPMVFRHSEREATKKEAGLATALHGTLLEPAKRKTTGWRATCECDGEPVRQTVLDPFAGSGTVGMVALRHGRSFVGIELNPTYAAMARERITGDAPLLNMTPGDAA